MLLSSKGIQYNEMKLNEDFTKESLQQLFPSATTFPVIVVDGFNIGGFNQLQKIINEQTTTTGKFLTEASTI
jgi:glutaredoxin